MKSKATKQNTGTRAEPVTGMQADTSCGAEDRFNCIATAAYFKAESRGFKPGQELDDWLDAEAQFNASGEH